MNRVYLILDRQNEETITVENNKQIAESAIITEEEDNSLKDETPVIVNEEINEEKSVNVEWSIDNKTNDDDLDEEGQMKIF